MAEIISFHRKKGEFLRAAVEQAEAFVSKCEAEAEWLRRNGAGFADQVKASLQINGAIELFMRRQKDLVRYGGAEACD